MEIQDSYDKYMETSRGGKWDVFLKYIDMPTVTAKTRAVNILINTINFYNIRIVFTF